MAARDTASLLVGLLVLFYTWGAWAAVEVNMEDRVEVYRGNTTQIACMFTSSDGVGGVIIQWFYVTRSGEKQKIYYRDATMFVIDQGTPYTDRINVTDTTGGIVLTIKDVQLGDELEFICLIKALTDGTGEGRTKLKVFAKPDRPSIEGVHTGISVNEEDPSKIGTCEVKNGFPKPNITWYRNRSPLRGAQGDILVVPSTTVESSGLFSVRSELSMKVMKEDKDDEFYCEITYYVPGGLGMTETNRINITVYYPSTAVSLWVESPKGPIKEGDSIELHCKGNGNAPSSSFAITRIGGDKVCDCNTVVLDNATRLDSGGYECTSTDWDTFDMVSGNTTVFVNYLSEAYVTPEDNVMGQGKEREITCNALSSLQTQTVWFKNDVEVSTGHTLTLKDATFDTAGIYVCVVTVPEIEGMEARSLVSVRVQGAPEIIEPDYTEIEESFDTTVDLTCTSRGFPTPDIIWTTSDGKIFNPEPKIEDYVSAQSVFSHMVTSDVTVTCNATNEFGTDSVTFNITAIIHTTTSATTTTTTTTTISSSTVINTTTSANTTTTTTNSSNTVKQEPAKPPEKIKEGNGVIIAVIIICILLLAILGSVLYFLYKKGKICGRSGKQDLTKEKSSKDSIVVEMKSDNTEEAVLLGVNGEKQPPSDQSSEYLDVQK